MKLSSVLSHSVTLLYSKQLKVIRSHADANSSTNANISETMQDGAMVIALVTMDN